MNEIPVVGKYFIAKIGSGGYMVGKIIKLGSTKNGYTGDYDDWNVKVLETNIYNYKAGDVVNVFINNNPLVDVEYFDHDYDVLSKVI